MKFTEKNIGDIIRRYSDGERIMITGVSDRTIHYKREDWNGLYSCDNEENVLLGSIDRSPDSLKLFLSTQTYSTTLDNAKDRAYIHIKSDDRAEILDGENSLRLILEQKKALQEQITKEANERKEALVVDFLKDYEKFPVGFKTDFFGVVVEKPMDGKGIIIEGIHHTENMPSVFIKDILLKTEKDQKTVKRPSFNELIKDASQRQGNQKVDKTEPERKKSNSEFYRL